MEKKPNYVLRGFVGAGIGFALAIINFIVPFFIIMGLGLANNGGTDSGLYVFLKGWQFIVPILMTLIGIPVCILIACIIKKK